MNIGFVCVNYNGSDDTCAAIYSLLSARKHNVWVVVVDNCSSEVERAKLEVLRGHSNVALEYSSVNLGYFGGLNAGIKILRERNPGLEWMIVGNNDLEFPGDFCDNLEAISQSLLKYPVVSPDIVTQDGLHQNPHVRKGIGFFREFIYDVYYSNFYLSRVLGLLHSFVSRYFRRGDEDFWMDECEIVQGHGSCYILSPIFFEEFKTLWAPTFLMGEEFFLGSQVAERGYKILYTPRLRVFHKWHASLNQLPSLNKWNFSKDAHKAIRLHQSELRRKRKI